MGKKISAKISRPTLCKVVQRTRLFALLDEKLAKPVAWVSAPAGSGKSTLVASYLDARELPCIWYKCDEGDADLATFFYYMGLAAKKAAPRYKKPLPLLTPEYLAGIPTFTRRYFEILYSRVMPHCSPSLSRMGMGAVIVLDNYQDVPAESPFHEMAATGFDSIPEGVHVMVISRSGPPSACSRLRANDKIGLLRYSDIRFTLAESMELVQRRIPALDNEHANMLHEKSQGWAAGIILMLERAGLGGTGIEGAADLACDRIFDYFAGEIFDRMEQVVRDFLLKTAFLSVLSVPLADRLTGSGSAGRILSTLNRRHYFTERLSGSEQAYQYHPLFREFLLNRAETACAPDEVAAVQRKAALLLEQDGRMEEAARLYGDAGDRDGLGRMVTGHARELLGQGRSKTVEEWLAAIPGGPADDEPWLLYWSGMCAIPVDMPRGRASLEKAFASFRAMGDTTGIYLSWAGIVDTYAFGLDEWQPLDGCITLFEELRSIWPDFPSQETDLIASSRMLIALTLRKTDQPQWVQEWLQRVSALLQENPSFDIQMDTMFCMSVYYLWKGEYDKNALLLERAGAEIRQRKPSPFAVIRLKLMKGIHYWITAQYDAALSTLAEGLEISTESGVLVFDSLLWGFRAAAEMASGNRELASDLLKQQMSTLLGMEKTLDSYFYHVNAAWFAILTGVPSRAVEHLDIVAAKAERMGTPYYRALWHIGVAQTEFMLGHLKEAKKHIQNALRMSQTMKSQVLEWYALLISAWFQLRHGKQTEGLLSLHRSLSLGRRHGYVHLEFYQPDVMRFLFAVALEEGIEPDYVKGVIRKLGLAPPQPPDCAASACCLEEWPYPIKIYTLGRFEIVKDDEPLHFTGKEQRKPLELLKALIARGGRDVPEERLNDDLWPDADGDQAHKSFETTLSRLRKLLGDETSITCRARQVAINPRCCWVDTLALNHVFEKIGQAPPEQSVLLREKAFGLYNGNFLPADTALSFVIASRETLRNRLLRIILAAGRHCEQAGEWEQAADYYAKGIETDNLAEEVYRCLMVCQRNLGNNAAVAKTFNRCRSLLQSELGIEPSPETTAVYTAMVHQQ